MNSFTQRSWAAVLPLLGSIVFSHMGFAAASAQQQEQAPELTGTVGFKPNYAQEHVHSGQVCSGPRVMYSCG